MGRARRLAAASAVVVVALVCGACESQSDAPSRAATGPSPSAPETSAPPGDAHAVPPPAPLTGAQFGDDLLIVGATTLPESLLRQIRSLRSGGVRSVRASAQFSLGQFTFEGKVFNVASVDGADFRRFTGPQSAPFQEQWERVAGGEVSVLDSMKPLIPADGNLPIGTGGDIHEIHVGATSPSLVGTVDAVVNEKWRADLDLPSGNALVISTGITSPQVVRKQLERIVGAETITDLDAVAEFGIDLGALQLVQPVGSFAEAVGVYRYRTLGNGRIAPDQAWVDSHITSEEVPILGTVTCNRFMIPQLRAALSEIQRLGLADKIHPGEYAGCYYPRFIAGSTKLSNHAFGLALDLNVPGNQRGTVGEMDRSVVAVFKRWGFTWGGDWGYTDPMHFEMNRLVAPR